jgi:lipopolysaccharide assembly outer membrane protein LptD (OstA)
LSATKFGLILAVGVVVASCRNDAHDVQRVRAQPQGPATIQYGISVVYADTSEVQWKLQSDRWEEERTANNPTRELFSGNVRASQWVGKRATGTEMIADRIIRDVKERVWELQGNVVIRTGDRKTLRTQSLFWNREEGRVYGDSWVEIREEGQTLSGTGFEAQDDLSTYSIFEVSGSADSN